MKWMEENISANTELTRKSGHYVKSKTIHFAHNARSIRPELMAEGSGCHPSLCLYIDAYVLFFIKYRISTTELMNVNTCTKYSMDYEKNKKKNDLFRMVMLVLWFVVCGSIIEREVIIYCFVF